MKSILKTSFFLSATILMVACGGKDAKKTNTETTAKEVASKTEQLDIEKPQLTFGFIKLTDMAPLAIAKEKGFF